MEILTVYGYSRTILANAKDRDTQPPRLAGIQEEIVRGSGKTEAVGYKLLRGCLDATLGKRSLLAARAYSTIAISTKISAVLRVPAKGNKRQSRSSFCTAFEIRRGDRARCTYALPGP